MPRLRRTQSRDSLASEAKKAGPWRARAVCIEIGSGCLEDEMSENLARSRVTAVELAKISEVLIIRNQIIPRRGVYIRGDIAEEATGILRVVKDVIECGTDVE
jgi:hypothetical protein